MTDSVLTDAADNLSAAAYRDDDAEAQAAIDAWVADLVEKATAKRGETYLDVLGRRAQLVAEACGEHNLTGEPYYSLADVLEDVERAQTKFGVGVPKIAPRMIAELARRELIPNRRIRERYEALEREKALTLYDLAVTMELDHGRGDTTEVERNLGLATFPSWKSTRSVRLFLPYERAVAYADALSIDYHDLGV